MKHYFFILLSLISGHKVFSLENSMDHFANYLSESIENNEKLNQYYIERCEYEKVNRTLYFNYDEIISSDPTLFQIYGTTVTDIGSTLPKTKEISDLLNGIQDKVKFYSIVIGGIPNYFRILKSPESYRYGSQSDKLYSSPQNGYYGIGNYGVKSDTLLAYLQNAFNLVAENSEVGENTIFNFFTFTKAKNQANINFVHTSFNGPLFTPNLQTLNYEMQNKLANANASVFANSSYNLDTKLKYLLDASVKALQMVQHQNQTTWEYIFEGVGSFGDEFAPWAWPHFGEAYYRQAAFILADFLNDNGMLAFIGENSGNPNIIQILATQEMENGGVTEYEIEFSAGMSKQETITTLGDWGITIGYKYAYYVYLFDLEPGFAGWFAWYDTYCLDQPPFIVDLISRIIAGPCFAIYGFIYNTDAITGASLSGWDYVFNTLDLIPGAAVFTGTKKLAVKSISIYTNSAKTVIVASSKKVISILAKLPPQIYEGLKTMSSKGLALMNEGFDKLVIVAKNIHGQVEKLARILNDGAVEILKDLGIYNSADEVLLDLGGVQVKMGDNIVSRNLQIVKTGDGQVFVKTVNNISSKLNDYPRLLAWHNSNMPSNVIDQLDTWPTEKLAKLEEDFVEGLEEVMLSNPHFINSWEVLIARTTQRKNFDFLFKTHSILKSEKLGITKNDLASISDVHLATGAECGNCINSFDKTLDNILNIENYIDGPSDFAKVLDDLMGTTLRFRGADWALQVVKEKPLIGKIQGFEVKIDDTENFTTDILTVDGNVLHYNECKNFSGTSNYLMTSGCNFLNQFTNTLSKVNSLDQVHYFFHPRYSRVLKDDIIQAFNSQKAFDLFSEIGYSKAVQLFPNDELITQSNFVNRIITNLSSTNIYSTIFN